MTDYPSDSMVKPDPDLCAEYGAAIQALSSAFQKEGVDKDALLKDATDRMTRYTPKGCADRFGLESGYSLAKEFYCDVLATSAGASARILNERDDPDAARAMLFDLYGTCLESGFGRETEFLCNPIHWYPQVTSESDCREFPPKSASPGPTRHSRKAALRWPERSTETGLWASTPGAIAHANRPWNPPPGRAASGEPLTPMIFRLRSPTT